MNNIADLLTCSITQPNSLAGLLLFYAGMLYTLAVAFFDLFRIAFPWLAL
jgi:hypothetical protein